MSGGLFSRSSVVALFAVLLGLAVSTFSQSASAQTAYCWINAKDGHPVPNSDLGPFGSRQDPLDPNHATISAAAAAGFPATSVTFVRGSDGSWSNAANGNPVPNSDLGPFGSHQDPLDSNHATISAAAAAGFPATSVTFVRVPCPPPSQPTNSTNMTPPASGPGGNPSPPSSPPPQNTQGSPGFGFGFGGGSFGFGSDGGSNDEQPVRGGGNDQKRKP